MSEVFKYLAHAQQNIARNSEIVFGINVNTVGYLYQNKEILHEKQGETTKLLHYYLITFHSNE